MSKKSLVAIFHIKLVQWILIPGILVTLGTVCIIGVNHKNSIQNEIEQLSKSLSQNVDFYINGAEEILKVVAVLPEDIDQEKFHSVFNKLHEEFNQFERIILLDKKGNIVASAPECLTTADFPIHFDRQAHGKHVLSSPAISPHSGTMVVYLSIPVKNGGHIVAELNLDYLQDFIYSFVSKDRVVILTDSYGNLIVHPDKELVATQTNIGDMKILRDIEKSRYAKFYKSDGKLFFGYSAKIPNTGWKLLVACPGTLIFKPAISLGMATGFLIICFFVLLTIGLKREFRARIIAPIMSYVNRLSAVADGIYPASNTNDAGFKELEYMGNVFDSMSQKVMEREHDLKVSRAYFQNVIDSMPSALMRIDEQMLVCQYNKKASEIFKGKIEGNSQVKVAHLFSEEQTIIDAVREAREFNIPRIMERKSFGDDMLSLYDITVYPLQGADIDGVVIRMDDVTARSRMEEMMVQTEKMMSVGGLAAGMAHEINNPLGGILQGAQNLERRFSSDIKANIRAAKVSGCTMENLQSYLKERRIPGIIDGIKEAGMRASSIVSNMLEFSKPGRDVTGTVNLADIINNSLELATKDYDLKKKYDFLHVKIVREFDPDLPQIICSRTEIEQVLFNLFKNAAQAMSEHGYQGDDPTIYVRTRKMKTGVAVEVEDNGPGISQEARRRVFEPFYTTKSTESGTGLGLSVSYFIITQNHGGTFIVDSKKGVGAKFTFTLPIKNS
ncbi:sensor histidine kinase [Maridesulfovibrio bastinii]|uniref:sensor histidine kinase n=1 Tax=Maridesulfovibrio bastinii TaxID=47157 RepID=UPI0003F6FE97|nr:PAS domain-containing sensor histidine kinase [Maridesulfovibrio bastinii]